MLSSYRIIISGKVQGVYYRQSTKEKALSLGIIGTVQNQPTGSVKVIATGLKQNILSLIEWCRKGPRLAKVESVQMEEIPFTPFETFSIIR
jgi:acylphosphatase